MRNLRKIEVLRVSLGGDLVPKDKSHGREVDKQQKTKVNFAIGVLSFEPTQVSGTLQELICCTKLYYVSFTVKGKDVVGAFNAEMIVRKY